MSLRLTRRAFAAGIVTLLVGAAWAAEVDGPRVVVLSNNAEASALNLGGENKLIVEGDVAVNSPHQMAIFNANSSIEVSGAIRSVGGYKGLGQATVSPQPERGEAVADPLAGLQIPAGQPTRSRKQLFIHSGNTATLQPGIYYGGVNLGKDTQVTLEPGVYLIADGDFAQVGGELRGEGVTIMMVGRQPGKLLIGNSASANLTAPAEGDFAGVVIASAGSDQAVGFNGAKAVLGGTIYAPRATVGVHFNSEVAVERVVCWQLMMNTAAVLNVGPVAAEGDAG